VLRIIERGSGAVAVEVIEQVGARAGRGADIDAYFRAAQSGGRAFAEIGDGAASAPQRMSQMLQSGCQRGVRLGVVSGGAVIGCLLAVAGALMRGQTVTARPNNGRTTSRLSARVKTAVDLQKPGCPRQDSNLRPSAPEADALSPELRGRTGINTAPLGPRQTNASRWPLCHRNGFGA
jgi:hypothetical protein